MNILADVIVGSLVAALIAFALYKTIKNRKKGGCSCNCGSCSKTCASKKSKTPANIQQ